MAKEGTDPIFCSLKMAQDHSLNTIVACVNPEKEVIRNGNNNLPPRKKNRGIMNILRIAAYMLRSKSTKSKSSNVEVASGWRKFMCSMRPFFVQANQSPPRLDVAKHEVNSPSIRAAEQELRKVEEVAEQTEVFTAPVSPARRSVGSSSDTASVFASALNLQELDKCDDGSGENGDSYYDDKVGDDMIDMKAEMFIASFYEQMRLQKITHGDPQGGSGLKE